MTLQVHFVGPLLHEDSTEVASIVAQETHRIEVFVVSEHYDVDLQRDIFSQFTCSTPALRELMRPSSWDYSGADTTSTTRRLYFKISE